MCTGVSGCSVNNGGCSELCVPGVEPSANDQLEPPPPPPAAAAAAAPAAAAAESSRVRVQCLCADSSSDAACSRPRLSADGQSINQYSFIENLYSPKNGRNNNELTNSTNKQQACQNAGPNNSHKYIDRIRYDR